MYTQTGPPKRSFCIAQFVCPLCFMSSTASLVVAFVLPTCQTKLAWPICVPVHYCWDARSNGSPQWQCRNELNTCTMSCIAAYIVYYPLRLEEWPSSANWTSQFRQIWLSFSSSQLLMALRCLTERPLCSSSSVSKDPSSSCTPFVASQEAEIDAQLRRRRRRHFAFNFTRHLNWAGFCKPKLMNS